MTVELRSELMRIMFGKEPHSYECDLDQGESDIDLSELDAYYNEAPPVESCSDENLNFKKINDKTVVEINTKQAKALLANLSQKSIKTLRFFTSETPVHLDDLVGKGKTYNSFNELKRSFVGPVNRRLRTVTHNKSAMLFLKADENKMAVKKFTAIALAEVIDV